MTTATPIQIRVNGMARDLAPETTILALIEEMSLELELVAVEVNGELVPRRELDRRPLRAGDRVEIVELVGGG